MPTPDELKAAHKIVAERAKCLTDKLFLSEVMGYNFVESVHKELFDQYIKYDPSKPWAFQSDIKKRLILWSRGHYKTTSIIVEIVQIILNFPDIRILIMQGSSTVTQTLLHQIKCHFTGENTDSRIQELFPEFCAPVLGTAYKFTVPARKNKGIAQATVTVAAPKTVKSGQHYDIGFFDDLVNDQNYRSNRLLTKVREDFNMCLPLLDPPHYAVVTGTRYAFGDTYEEIIRKNKGEWKVSVTTCWLPDGSVRFPQQTSKNGQKIIGFTRDGLNLLRDNDPEMFGPQYLNQPVQKGGQVFTKELMESALILPSLVPALSPAVFFIDLASTDEAYSDDCVILVGKHDSTMTQYVVDCRGDKWLPDVFIQNIIEMTLIHRPVKIYFEKTASCQYLVAALQLAAKYHTIFLPIEYIKVNNQPDAKNLRIGPVAGVIKRKKLKFLVGLNRWDKIVEQFGIWPGSRKKHDDYADTIGHMVHTFGGVALQQPIRNYHSHPIIALMQQMDSQDTAHVMDEVIEDGTEGIRF